MYHGQIKHADVTHLSRQNQHNQDWWLSSHISIITNVKSLEKLSFIESMNILLKGNHDCQSGFRPGHSTQLAISE